MINLGNATVNRLLFCVLLAAYVLLMFRYIARTYDHGFVVTYLVALIFASAGMITLVAIVWEHRTIWPLTATYASAWVNDLFILCVVAGVLSIIHQRLPGHTGPAWWPYVAAIVAIGAGAFFHFVIDGGYPSDVAWSPTHVAHSFGAFPIFTYLLLRGAPAWWYGLWNGQAKLSSVVVAGIVAFVLVYPILDVRVLHTFPWNAHGPYDWARLQLKHPLTPQDPGYIAPDLVHNGPNH